MPYLFKKTARLIPAEYYTWSKTDFTELIDGIDGLHFWILKTALKLVRGGKKLLRVPGLISLQLGTL